MSRRLQVTVLAVVIMVASAPLARAQAGEGARLSGFYAGAVGEGHTNVSAGGSVGYRFNDRFGFEFEALALPDFETGDTTIDRNGRGVAFLTNFVTEFPSPAAWLTPYVQGGGGAANIRYSTAFAFEDRDGRRIPAPRDRRRIGGFPPFGDDMRAIPVDRARSETSLALSVGGGVDFRLWRGLAAGPNITFMKLFGSGDELDLTRIGVRASYRF